MLTHFRKRFSQEALAEINASIAQSAIEKGAKEAASKSDDQDDPPRPKGKLIVDATCRPADISDPTDLNLLGEAREKTEAIIDRIVSIRQPQVRPIVRGKAGAKVEFGAKVSIRLVSGMSFVDRISWDAYNESHDLEAQIEAYRKRFGDYPVSVEATGYACRDREKILSKTFYFWLYFSWKRLMNALEAVFTLRAQKIGMIWSDNGC